MRSKYTAAIKVRIDAVMKQKLAAEANIQGLDISDVVRKAIALYFANRLTGK
jgi:hypothetical protein